MAYFKKQQLKSNGKWYPKSVTIGRPVDTDTVTDGEDGGEQGGGGL